VTASDRGEGNEAGGLRSLVSLFALTGCVTTKPDPAQFEAADNEKCIGYGTTPGTPARMAMAN
jgi:hypothetical protein